jgi:uncharacterized protein YidB (DUF937 family)
MADIKDNLFSNTATNVSSGAVFTSPRDAQVARALVDVLSTPSSSPGIPDFRSFTDRLASSGLTEVRSWMTRNQNVPVTTTKLEKALEGTQVVTILVDRTGLERSEVLDRLTWILPRIVHEVTPFGRVESQKAVEYHLHGLKRRLRG